MGFRPPPTPYYAVPHRLFGCFYTVFRKKHPTRVFDFITHAFLGQFLYFYVPMNTLGYREVSNIILTAFSTLPIRHHILRRSCDRPFLQCVRSNQLFATFTGSCLMFIFFIFLNNFVKKYTSLPAENLSHFRRF